MPWTVNGANVYAADEDLRSADWQRDTVSTTLGLAGTGVNEYHQLGYGPYVLRLPVDLPPEAGSTVATLRGLQGNVVSVSNGTSTWTAVLDKTEIYPLVSGIGGYAGTLTRG